MLLFITVTFYHFPFFSYVIKIVTRNKKRKKERNKEIKVKEKEDHYLQRVNYIFFKNSFWSIVKIVWEMLECINESRLYSK